MRCIQLLDTDGFAGTEQHVLTLSRRLIDHGIESWIGCRTGGQLQRRAVTASLPVIELGLRPGLAMLASLVKQSRRLGVDAIHAHNGRGQLFGAVAHQVIGTDLFVTQHFIAPRFTTYRGLKRKAADVVHHWVNKNVEHTIAVSNAARDAMIAREKIRPNQISVIPNGVDPAETRSSAQTQSTRTLLNLPANAPVVCTVARLELEKGIADLIDAIPAVLRAVPDAHFVIAGEGSARDQLQALITGLNLDSRVRLLGFRSDVPDLIAAADLFVLPSPAEPFGLVLLEAMAAGKPVVAVAAGGPLEIVEDGLTGTLVPPNNREALSKAITCCLIDPARESTGDAGRQRFTRLFSADHMAVKTMAVYQGGRHAGRRVLKQVAVAGGQD